MTKQTNTSTYQEEIDLVELIKVLWTKKIPILLITCLFVLLAGIYAFTAKEQWTSKAEVIEPQLNDLNSYLTVQQEYARILHTDFKAQELSTQLFSHFTRLAASSDERRQFFEQSPLYQSLIAEKNEEVSREILETLVATNVSIVKPDPKKEPNAIGQRLSLSAQTAKEAQETLNSFVQFINEKAFSLDKQNFLIMFERKLNDLRYEQKQINQTLIAQKQVSLNNLDNAYTIAKTAGISNFSQAFNESVTIPTLALSDAKIPLSDSKLSDGSYLFMLGTKYLKAQIDTIAEADIIYPPRYYEITNQLQDLEPLYEKAKATRANTFKYQASPSYPIKKDWPKRTILLLIGAVLGGIIGSIWVLLRHFLGRN
ncbi:LPS O-antigen chain length determinant protein WzzB [Pelistega ratti]|uniref:LPS O-antigen chain length determinant protein WzzB n=1 Tax=Pelistega ratti TaxID=2652177 RepID=UPI00135884E8|nr:Wzz/FepE/Etk N-terminal domain-containing protein [Pelistega ratti]